VIVGPPAGATIRIGAGAAPQELLRLFEDAFSSGRGLVFQYVDKDGVHTRRTIEPHGLLVQSPVWYILARDVDNGLPRTFRMDRISRPRIVESIHFQPELDIIRVQVPTGTDWRPLAVPRS
jgi:predicted DNA-binding transcriptional regulator YafY